MAGFFLRRIIADAGTADFGPTLAAYLTSVEVGPFCVLGIVAAIIHLVRRNADTRAPGACNGILGSRHFGFAACSMCGWAITAGFGWNQRLLPPVFHDEYAYRFQAETFLDGRLAEPGLPLEWRAAFEQPHLLTTPVYASRYYPGTALWFMPSVALEMPWTANWLAAGLTAGFMARVGWRWSARVGWLTGLLVACAPATFAFGNLLLSPMPTMLALAIFLDAYFENLQRPAVAPALSAGLAMAAAFVTRPLTAVGLGLPFACWSLLQCGQSSERRTWIATAALIGGFVVGPCGLAWYNASITGNPLQSPYGLYMATKTPSHQFGFYNRTRGKALRTDSTLVAYDDWTDDLTPSMAPDLIAQRWTGLLKWTVGLTPGIAMLTLTLLGLSSLDAAALLAALACAGLTAAYVPYWFVGLLGFSYVAEAMPFLLLLFARAACAPARSICWRLLFVLAIGTNIASTIPLLTTHGSELMYPRLQAAERARLESQLLRQSPMTPMLILFDLDLAKELHSTIVFNKPTLDAPIVRAWDRPECRQLLLDRFSNRMVYLIHPGSASRRAHAELIRGVAR